MRFTTECVIHHGFTSPVSFDISLAALRQTTISNAESWEVTNPERLGERRAASRSWADDVHPQSQTRPKFRAFSSGKILINRQFDWNGNWFSNSQHCGVCRGEWDDSNLCLKFGLCIEGAEIDETKNKAKLGMCKGRTTRKATAKNVALFWKKRYPATRRRRFLSPIRRRRQLFLIFFFVAGDFFLFSEWKNAFFWPETCRRQHTWNYF